jgi:DNA-binding CsgD family transcriptional regulator
LSPRTIEFHRDNVRKKIGIKNRKINLRTHLLSLQEYR